MVKKGRKKVKVDAIADKKVKELKKLRDFFRNHQKEYEEHLNSKCKKTCETIKKLYMDSLAAIPEELRNMTVSEIIAYQEKAAAKKSEQDCYKTIMSDFERNKQMSEKKKTQRISRVERKRSLSASMCSSVSYSAKPPLTRVLSEANLNTPLAKRIVAPAFSVTPKFNPRTKINNALLRKPRAGEILMSVSGSPLVNVMDDLLGKPGVAISLGCGKVVNITADKEIENLQQDISKIDENTKVTLQLAKKKLEEILKNS